MCVPICVFSSKSSNRWTTTETISFRKCGWNVCSVVKGREWASGPSAASKEQCEPGTTKTRKTLNTENTLLLLILLCISQSESRTYTTQIFHPVQFHFAFIAVCFSLVWYALCQSARAGSFWCFARAFSPVCRREKKVYYAVCGSVFFNGSILLKRFFPSLAVVFVGINHRHHVYYYCYYDSLPLSIGARKSFQFTSQPHCFGGGEIRREREKGRRKNGTGVCANVWLRQQHRK